MPNKNIIWLASYPKSGNTWVRIFLANYLNQKPVDINAIDSSIISSSRHLFDNYSGILSSDLSHDEIDMQRPLFYQKISEETNDVQFIKTHDAFTLNTQNKAIFPETISKGVIYIVRNPLDVAVSFAYHLGIDPNISASNLNKETFQLAGKSNRLNKQFRQKLLSWSDHYLSWKHSGMNFLLIRYEDLLENPILEFKKIIEFIDWELNQKRLLKAIEDSSFTKLKHQELENNFKEKPIKSKHFFRKGGIGNWKEELNSESISMLYLKHREVIQALNYSDIFYQ
jgi:hypothetical protein